MNPAVTIGVLAVGAMGVGEAVGYIISPLLGDVAGALLLRTVLGGVATGSARPHSRTALLLAPRPSRSRQRPAS
jgi:glycerol uptake facilitator-like aquaporin